MIPSETLIKPIEGSKSTQTLYGKISLEIERLHSMCPALTELKAGNQTIKLPSGNLHGFTTSWPVWYNPPLPPAVKDFLKEGIKGKNDRLDIDTNVFCVPRTDLAYFNKPKALKNVYPHYVTREQLESGEVGFTRIGEDRFHILTLSTQGRELEIEVQWGFYTGGLDELLTPCFSLRGRFFTFDENGMIQRQDDPRNFYIEDGIPSQDQTDLVTNVLRFALEERKIT